MTYTPAQYKAFASLLRRARKHLAVSSIQIDRDTKTAYICHALSKAELADPNGWHTVEQLKQEIRRRLGGPISLEGWLLKKKLVTDKTYFLQHTRDKTQKHRHAWVKSMITEFSALAK